MPVDPIRVLITAGPTYEPIDAVRFIGNRSSGRMGIALAMAAVTRGWSTTLLLGPVSETLPVDSQIALHRFRTAAELGDLLTTTWPDHDLLIMAAAVADFRPARPASGGKLRRTEAGLTLDLEPTPDLLAALAEQTRDDQMTVGFALEPASGLIERAREKLGRKHLDAIVANPLETMDAETVSATLIKAGGEPVTAPHGASKADFATWLLDQLARDTHRPPTGSPPERKNE